MPEQSAGSGVESVLLGLVCLLSVGLYWCAAEALTPGETWQPGSNDTDVLYDEYLSKDEQEAYNNFLIDLCAVNDKAAEANRRAAAALERVIWVFKGTNLHSGHRRDLLRFCVWLRQTYQSFFSGKGSWGGGAYWR